jgi:hypothetical protein
MTRLVALGSISLVACSSIAFAPAAQAEGGDQRMCVTRGEFRAVQDGMTRERVHAIFDSPGKRESINYMGDGYISEHRSYRPCVGAAGSVVYASFNNYSADQPGMRIYSKYMYIYS